MNSWACVELFSALGLSAAVLGAGVAYGVRVRLRGKARYERVERQETSALLSRAMMECVYWSVQPLARLLIRLGVTPNQLSWSSLALAVASALQLGAGRFGPGAWIALASALLDLLDGHVARETGTESRAGQVLDASLDRYNEFLVLGALAFHYRTSPKLLLLCLAALAGSMMVSYSTALAERWSYTVPRGGWHSLMRRPERAGILILGAALSPNSILWLEKPAPGPAGYPMIAAIALVAALANISAAARLHAIARQGGGSAPSRPQPSVEPATGGK